MKFESRVVRISRLGACAVFAGFVLVVASLAPAAAQAQLSASELETLVAPIALYPDPLLAQVLPAATYPDQVAEAAAYVAKNGTNGVDKQGWDASVAAVARYSEAIQLLGNDPNWTYDLGTAFLDQTTGVMDAIQQMRSRAKASGALQDSPQQKVVYQEEAVRIVPADPEIIYVPQYDPQVVYVQSAPQEIEIEIDDDDDVDWDDALVAGAIGFGAGVAMGAWFDMDCDWWGGGCYYHGGAWGGGSNYWHGGNYNNFNRNTNINVDKSWRNSSRPGGVGNRGNRNRPSTLPSDRRGNRQDNRTDRRGEPGRDDNRTNRQDNRTDRRGEPGRTDNRTGRQDNRTDRRTDAGRGGDRERQSAMDRDRAAKRERAQNELRGRQASASDRRAGADAGARGDRAGGANRGDRAGTANRSDRAGAANRGDRGMSDRGSRDALGGYQRGSDARKSSDRGARSRQNSSFDRGGGGGGRSFGGGGGRSASPRSSGGGRSGGGRSGGGGRGGGGRGGGGRRG